jgi:hypothetical protein
LRGGVVDAGPHVAPLRVLLATIFAAVITITACLSSRLPVFHTREQLLAVLPPRRVLPRVPEDDDVGVGGCTVGKV